MKSKHWKTALILIYFISLPTYGQQPASELRPLDILANAMVKTRRSTYSCSIDDSQLLNMFNAFSGRYIQFLTPDGILLRKMTFAKKDGKPFVTLLANRNGNFFCLKGKWRKVMDIHPLYYFDQMSEAFSLEELSLSSFAMELMKEKEGSIRRITMDVVQNAQKLKNVCFEMPLWGPDGDNDVHSKYYVKRPFKRVFIIDEKTGLLKNRMHYDISGKLVYKKTIEDMKFPGDLTEEVFSEGKVEGGAHLFFGESYRKAMSEK